MEQNSIDARGARLALRMYIKWSWVAIVALVAGFMIGSSLSSSTTVEGESTLVVGLTDEVRWPFFDAVLARQQGLIEDFDLAAQTAEATGVEHKSVTVEAENTQNSTLTIAVVVDGDADDAAVFANELGDQLVQANADAQALSYVEEAQSLQDQLDDQRLLELGFETDIADLTAEWVAIQDEIVIADVGDIAELRGEAIVADRARRVAERRLDGVIAFETSLITQLAQAEREASNSASTVEISRSASAVSGSATDLGPVLAILNLLLALLFIPFLERGFGRVGSIDQLALLFADAKLIDSRYNDSGAVQPVDVVALSVKSLEARRHGALPETQYPPLVVAETGLTRTTDEILSAVSVGGRRVSLADLDTPAGLDAAVDADQVVLVVPSRSMRVGKAKDLASALALLDAAPEVVVLSKKAPRGSDERVYSSLDGATVEADLGKISSGPARARRAETEESEGKVAVPPPARRRKMTSALDPNERLAVAETPAEDETLDSLLGETGGSSGGDPDKSDTDTVGSAASERRAMRASRRKEVAAGATEADASKATAAKADASKATAAKADASKATAAKADASKATAAKADASKAADAGKADASKATAGKADASKATAAKSGAAKADASKAAAAKSGAAKADASKADAGKATESTRPTPRSTSDVEKSMPEGSTKTASDSSGDASTKPEPKSASRSSNASSSKPRPRLPVKDKPESNPSATGKGSNKADDKAPAGSS